MLLGRKGDMGLAGPFGLNGIRGIIIIFPKL